MKPETGKGVDCWAAWELKQLEEEDKAELGDIYADMEHHMVPPIQLLLNIIAILGKANGGGSAYRPHGDDLSPLGTHSSCGYGCMV